MDCTKKKQQSFHHHSQYQLNSKAQVESSVQDPKDFRRGDANALNVPMSLDTDQNCA
jgi:hypothetical protein